MDETTPTGTCGVCVVDRERSLVANLAAANNYKVGLMCLAYLLHIMCFHFYTPWLPQAEHLKQPAVWALAERATIVYSAGFFITVSPEARMLLAKQCAEHNRIYATNLSAPFISQVPPFKKTLMDEMPYVDFLFGNELEAAAFAESEGWDARDLKAVALKVCVY